MNKKEFIKAIKSAPEVYGMVNMVAGADPVSIKLVKVDLLSVVEKFSPDAKFGAYNAEDGNLIVDSYGL